MVTMEVLAARWLGKFLADDFREIFSSARNESTDQLVNLAHIAIGWISRSDALYHSFEHTMLVTIVGRDILRGLAMSRGIKQEDYTHLIVACLLHDIGFVRGVLRGDTDNEFVIDQSGQTTTLPRGASDAALAPYHVDRSKLFVFERTRELASH